MVVGTRLDVTLNTYIFCLLHTLRLSDMKQYVTVAMFLNYRSTNKILRTICKYITHRNTKLHTYNV